MALFKREENHVSIEWKTKRGTARKIYVEAQTRDECHNSFGEIVANYFGDLHPTDFEIIEIKEWRV